MQMRHALLASVCLTFVLAANVDLSLAQGASALTGVVTSEQEGPDGRRSRHRQEGGLDHRNHRRHQQGRPLQLPGVAAGAGRIHDQDPRRRL